MVLHSLYFVTKFFRILIILSILKTQIFQNIIPVQKAAVNKIFPVQSDFVSV